MIIPNPVLTQALVRAGKLKPITSSPTSTFPGRMIGVTLSFPNFSNRPSDTYRRKAKGSITFFLYSIYHSFEAAEQRKFYDELDHFSTNRSRNYEVLLGADVNYNVGIRSLRFWDILGPHGIDNRNLKGQELLYLYKSNDFKILLSFFKHTNYVSYRSFNDAKTPHMLNNFVSCRRFFKRISDCKVTNLGVRSGHAAIMTRFRLTAIKFNNERNNITIIEWKKNSDRKRRK